MKGQRSRHLHIATYRETRATAVYNARWRTDQH